MDRWETFACEEDRSTCLALLQQNLRDAGVRVLGWCLMTNHVHLIAVPAREDSLSVLLLMGLPSKQAPHDEAASQH